MTQTEWIISLDDDLKDHDELFVGNVRDGDRLIRCKDCKWYYRGGATCMFWDGANGMCGDDFCGKAERRKENG